MKLGFQTILPLVIFTLLLSCKEKVTEKKEVIRPVTYEEVSKMSAQQIRTFSGVASAGNELELSFRNNGIVTVLNAKVGQTVKKGALIARLDNVQAKLAYEQAVSSLNASQSAMTTAKSTLDRSRALYEKGSQSLSDYESAKNAYQSALDQHESAKRTKEIKQSQINYGAIYAPKDGIIAVKNVSLNETVSTGQVIVVMNAGNEIQIEVGLPGNAINKVALGMETSILFSAIASTSIIGNVAEVAPMVNANASTFLVKIDIVDPPSTIRPGMVADVTFTFGASNSSDNANNPIVIPVESVGEDGNGNFVFTINSSDGKIGTVKKQTITIGKLTSNGFVVLDGLSEGDKIATAGLQSLLDGQKVKLQ